MSLYFFPAVIIHVLHGIAKWRRESAGAGVCHSPILFPSFFSFLFLAGSWVELNFVRKLKIQKNTLFSCQERDWFTGGKLSR